MTPQQSVIIPIKTHLLEIISRSVYHVVSYRAQENLHAYIYVANQIHIARIRHPLTQLLATFDHSNLSAP